MSKKNKSNHRNVKIKICLNASKQPVVEMGDDFIDNEQSEDETDEEYLQRLNAEQEGLREEIEDVQKEIAKVSERITQSKS